MRRFYRRSPNRKFMNNQSNTQENGNPNTLMSNGQNSQSQGDNPRDQMQNEQNMLSQSNHSNAQMANGQDLQNQSINNQMPNQQNLQNSNSNSQSCQCQSNSNEMMSGQNSQIQSDNFIQRMDAYLCQSQNRNSTFQMANGQNSQNQNSNLNTQVSNTQNWQSQGSNSNSQMPNQQGGQSQSNNLNGQMSNQHVSQSNNSNSPMSDPHASQNQNNNANNQLFSEQNLQSQSDNPNSQISNQPNNQSNNSNSPMSDPHASQNQNNNANNQLFREQNLQSQSDNPNDQMSIQQNWQSQNNTPNVQIASQNCVQNNQLSNQPNSQSQNNNDNVQTQSIQIGVNNQNIANSEDQTINQNQNGQAKLSVPIRSTLSENIEYIKTILGNPTDLVIRELTIGNSQNENQINQDSKSQGNYQSGQNQKEATKGQDSGQSTQAPNDSQDTQGQHLNLNQNSQSNNQKSSQQQGGSFEDSSQKSQNSQCSIVYINGITDSTVINENILKMIQSSASQQSNMLDEIYQRVIAITDTKKVNTVEQVVNGLLAGNAIFLLDGEMTALEMSTSKFEKRSLNEPQSESVIRGPRLALIEDIDTNISLIRKEIKDPNLRFDIHKVGRRANQKIAVCYMNGVINPDIVNEVSRRLKTIDIDFTPDSGFVEQWLQDNFLSPFPQLLDTERLDRVLYGILQGKVAILVDGSPFALLAPISLGDSIQSIEDFNQRWVVGTLIRLLRILAIFIAVFLPSLYVALVSYHPGMLPTQLTFSIAATREEVPFPSVVEVLLMAITFEILQEAGIRLPKAIGQTVGIVGGIVIGDVAVSAGIVGPSLVIVTSLTAISSFTIPNYSFAVSMRIIRFSFVLGAALLGLYGIIIVFIIICIHLVNLKSMGIPYTGPFAPNFLSDMKNIIIRAPIMNLKRRPPFLEPEDIQKMNSGGSRNE